MAALFSSTSRPSAGSHPFSVAARWLLLAVLVAAPAIIGGVHQTTMFILSVPLVIAGLLTLARSPTRRLRIPVCAALLVAVIVLVSVLQLLPLPQWLTAILAPRTTDWLTYLLAAPGSARLDSSRWLSAALSPHEAYLALFKVAFGTLFFVLCLRHFRGRRVRSYPLIALAGAGVLSFWLGLVHTLSGAESILGLYQLKQVAPYPFMATFVNANFQASFYAICGFSALGLSRTLGYRHPFRFAFLLAAVFSFCGVMLTFSRGGMLLLPVFILLFFIRHRHLERALGSVLLVLVGAFLLVSLYLASSKIGYELSTLLPYGPHNRIEKYDLWPDMLRMAVDFWTLGVGPGAFPTLLPHYAPGLGQTATFLSGENELLQLFVDYGLFFGPLILAGLAWCVATAFRLSPRRANLQGGMAAVLFVLCHNLVDYNLTALGVMVPLLAIMAALFTEGLERHEDGEPAAVEVRHWVVPQWALALWCCLLVVLAVGLARLGEVSLPSISDRLHTLSMARHTPPREMARALDRAQRWYPTDYYTYALMGFNQLTQGERQDGERAALHYASRALFLNEHFWLAHFTVGEYLDRHQAPVQALTEYRLALTYADSDNTRTFLLRHVSRALTDLDRLALLAGDEHSSQDLLYRFLATNGKADEAYAFMQGSQYLPLAKATGQGLETAALVLRSTKHLEELKALLDHAGRRFPDAEWIYRGRAHLKREAHDYRGAFEILQSAEKRLPPESLSVDFYVELGSLFALQGDLEGLSALIERVGFNKQVIAPLLYQRALLYLQKDATIEGMHDLQAVSQLQPQWTAPVMTMASAWERKRRWDLAAHHYEKVLAIAPDNSDAHQGLERVKAARDKERLEDMSREGVR